MSDDNEKVENNEVENNELTLLEADIDESKNRLERVMGELDRRRHRSFVLKELLRRHKVWVGVAAVATGGVLTAVLVHQARKKSRRESLRWRSPIQISFRRDARGRSSPAAEPVRPLRALLKVLFAFTTGAAPVVGRYLAERVQRVATTSPRY